VMLWRPWAPDDAPRAVVVERPRPTAPAPPRLPSTQAAVAPSAPAPAVQTPRLARSRVAATSVPAVEERRPVEDPLIALTRAVQAIPADAWARGSAPSDPQIDPIAIAPLEIPAIPDVPAEPTSSGGP
jgi:hypothetical protein